MTMVSNHLQMVGFFSKWWPSRHLIPMHPTSQWVPPKWRGGIAPLGGKERICGVAAPKAWSHLMSQIHVIIRVSTLL